jgi:transposase-like protein
MSRTTIFQRMTMQQAVLEAIENGCTVSEAAECAGITRACVYAWLKKGREEDDLEYMEFYRKFNLAVGRTP